MMKIVKFVSARNDGVMTKVEGRVSFPQRNGPQPQEGSVWAVEIAGSNPRNTVNFLRLIKPVEVIGENRGLGIRDDTLTNQHVVIRLFGDLVTKDGWEYGAYCHSSGKMNNIYGLTVAKKDFGDHIKLVCTGKAAYRPGRGGASINGNADRVVDAEEKEAREKAEFAEFQKRTEEIAKNTIAEALEKGYKHPRMGKMNGVPVVYVGLPYSTERIPLMIDVDVPLLPEYGDIEALVASQEKAINKANGMGLRPVGGCDR